MRLEIAAHPASQVTADRQTQPGALGDDTGPRKLHERLEDRLQLADGNPDARVVHPDFHLPLVARYGQRDAAAWRRVLHGVRNEIENDLLCLVPIDADRRPVSLEI